MACLVISLKVTRLTWSGGSLAYSLMCQAIDSPSRSVGRQPDRIGLAGLVSEPLELPLAFLEGLVAGSEVVLHVDAQGPLRQVANVAVGGNHAEAVPQVPFDGLGLGGRFDDHQIAMGTLLGGHRSGSVASDFRRPGPGDQSVKSQTMMMCDPLWAMPIPTLW